MVKFLGLLCATALVGFAQDSDSTARGKYLVEELAKCHECHTPKTETGELDTSQWLKGATLDFQPIHEAKGWHKTSPDLTSAGRLFTRWGEAGIEKLLETGVGPSGHAADPPMPAYKLHADDAKANRGLSQEPEMKRLSHSDCELSAKHAQPKVESPVQSAKLSVKAN